MDGVSQILCSVSVGVLYFKSSCFYSHTGFLMYISKRFSYRFVFSNIIAMCTINLELLLVMVAI